VTALAAAAALPVPGGLATGRAAALACLFDDRRGPGPGGRRSGGWRVCPARDSRPGRAGIRCG